MPSYPSDTEPPKDPTIPETLTLAELRGTFVKLYGGAKKDAEAAAVDELVGAKPTEVVEDEGAGWVEVDDMAQAQGVLFDCPGCGDHRVLVLFRDRAPDDHPADPSPGKRWAPAGSSLADLTLTPSIALLSGCRWHGWIKDGRATDVRIRPFGLR